MICIGKPYVETVDGQARLCAPVSIGDRGTILWFGVEERYARFFTRRADPFVMALLAMAFRRGLDIRCDAPVSERLLHQLETYHIPTIANSGIGSAFASMRRLRRERSPAPARWVPALPAAWTLCIP